MLCSYSVIVPVLNESGGIVGTLRSIVESMAYFDDCYPGAATVHGEIIVVDEGSTDGTLEHVQECARVNPRLRLVEHHRSLGSGAARNTGVRLARGEVLFYCDVNDRYFREHILVGFSLLDRPEGAQEKIPVNTGHSGSDEPFAAVRTGVHFKQDILPYWRMAIGNSIPLNLCVRRECHEWTEGFPDQAVYRRIGGCEDGAYNCCLDTFFRVGQVDLETVEHVRTQGNSFDLQMDRFQRPPGSDFDLPHASSEGLHSIRLQLERQKIRYLLDKWRVLGAPPLPAGLLNWNGVVEELLSHRMPEEAMQIAEQATCAGQRVPVELMAKIRKSLTVEVR